MSWIVMVVCNMLINMSTMLNSQVKVGSLPTLCVILLIMNADFNADSIKSWLSEQGKDRAWLAQQCHVSKTTVDGWLSGGRTIPGPAQTVLRHIMDPGIAITPRLDLGTVNVLMKRAASLGITFEAYVEAVLTREAARPDAEVIAMFDRR
jgi:DNA-binding transcriptional regulator YiaG